MQLPKLTLHQIRSRCTEQSFERGLEYFHAGAIGNPVLQDWTLSATCQGSYPKPYRTSVELMLTGIAATRCSCPYDADGDPVCLKIEGEIAEDVREDISYNLEAIDPFETAEYIVEADFNSYNTG